MSTFLACIRCGVEINAESAVDGNRCARCPPSIWVPLPFQQAAFDAAAAFDERSGPEAGVPAVSSALVQAEPPAPPPAEQETPRAQGVPPAPPRRRGGR